MLPMTLTGFAEPMCRSVGLLDEALGCNATLLGEGVHLYTTAHSMGMSSRS